MDQQDGMKKSGRNDMTLMTRLFGEIEIKEEKVITFENGIIGFPHMTRFILIFDEERESSSILWMQSLDEPQVALPVIDPLKIKPDYNPTVEDEILKPLGELKENEMLVLTTLVVPENIEKMTANLKAPMIINAGNQKAYQMIVEEDYPVKFPVYQLLKEKAGE